MRRLKVDSTTDDPRIQAYGELLQASNIREVVLTVASQPETRSDGAVEHVEPVIEVSSEFTPGQELRENMRTYSRRLAEYKRNSMKASATILHSTLQDTCLFVAPESDLVLNRVGLMAAFPRNRYKPYCIVESCHSVTQCALAIAANTVKDASQ